MPLCQILYSEEYKSTMQQLRHFLENKVYSEEALKLTETALELLASHYTTWQYRFAIIKALNKDLYEELDWCELVALDNEKNYQIWNYRQLIIEEILADPETAKKFDYRREFPILDMMLQQDSKNHHVWSYRKWFVERFQLYRDQEEIEFLRKLINLDLRNNSAWTHMFFLNFSQKEMADVDEEIDFCKQRIGLCPQNPSSWNYLMGIYTKTQKDITELKLFCEEYGNLDETVKSSFALETLAKIDVKEGDKEGATKLYKLLAEKYDPIRANYWAYIVKKIT